MAEFLIYRTDAGTEVRGKVLKRYRNGAARVEAWFFQRDGKDVPGFLGYRYTVMPRDIVKQSA